jgi:hypothetical protein
VLDRGRVPRRDPRHAAEVLPRPATAR